MQSNRSLLPSIRPNPGTEPDPGTLMVGLGPERMGIGSPIGTAGTSTSSPTVVRAATPTKLRISDGVSAGMLLSPIRPTYPPIAIATRTQGIVVVTATIDKSGRIVGAQAISGPPKSTPPSPSTSAWTEHAESIGRTGRNLKQLSEPFQGRKAIW
jgi:protein TonB